jgi:hypothetical protein
MAEVTDWVSEFVLSNCPGFVPACRPAEGFRDGIGWEFGVIGEVPDFPKLICLLRSRRRREEEEEEQGRNRKTDRIKKRP